MKLHPYGVEFGILQRLLGRTNSKTLQTFLTNEFSSVGNRSANEICKVAKLKPNINPRSLTREQIDKLLSAMQKVKIQRPPLDCLSPIGEKDLEKSLKKEYPDAEHICTVTREPSVYRGHPFQIEIGIVYGIEKQDNQVDVLRFANRVPLMYQAGACAITEAVKDIDWKRYGLQQSGNNLPLGPVTIIVHMCSVWVPFISESKEAIAPYPEIVKEMKLALQDCGRKLSLYLSGKRRAGEQKRRLQIFERYADEVANSLSTLADKDKKDIEKRLKELIDERIKIKEAEKEIENKIEKNESKENIKDVNKKIDKEKKNEGA
jgi:DNA topoisomerase-6 subunit B